MILNLFLSIFLIIFVLIILGIRLDMVYGIMAGFFLFILGSSLLWVPLTYPAGEATTTTYTYLNSTSGVINTTLQNTTQEYTTFSEKLPFVNQTFNHILSYFLAFMGIVTIIFFIITFKKGVKA